MYLSVWESFYNMGEELLVRYVWDILQRKVS